MAYLNAVPVNIVRYYGNCVTVLVAAQPQFLRGVREIRGMRGS